MSRLQAQEELLSDTKPGELLAGNRPLNGSHAALSVHSSNAHFHQAQWSFIRFCIQVSKSGPDSPHSYHVSGVLLSRFSTSFIKLHEDPTPGTSTTEQVAPACTQDTINPVPVSTVLKILHALSTDVVDTRVIFVYFTYFCFYNLHNFDQQQTAYIHIGDIRQVEGSVYLPYRQSLILTYTGPGARNSYERRVTFKTELVRSTPLTILTCLDCRLYSTRDFSTCYLVSQKKQTRHCS